MDYVKIILICSILLFGFKISAQFDYNRLVEETHNNILDLNFEEANNRISNFKNNNNKAWYWLKGQSIFIEYLTTSKLLSNDSVLTEIDICIKYSKRNTENSPYKNYSLIDLYLFKSYILYKSDNYLATIQAYLKVNKLINHQLEEYPDFVPNTKFKLIQNIINNYITHYFNWTEETDIDLKNLIKPTPLFKEKSIEREFKIIVPILYYATQNNKQLTNTHFNWLNEEFGSKGPLESFTRAFASKKTGNYTHLETTLAISDSLKHNTKFNYLNLMYGNILLNNQNKNTITYLEAFINNNKTKNGNAYALLKSSWFYFINNEHRNSTSLVKKIQNITVDNFELDIQAKYEIRNSENWNSEILLSRILFDGGNYNKSLEVLLNAKDQLKTFNAAQRLEFAYRIARVYEKLNDYDNAIRFYKMVISSNLDKDFYYPCYAAYYCANIFNEQNNSILAKKYYNFCLNLESPIYKSYIHKKARKAIDGLSAN